MYKFLFFLLLFAIFRPAKLCRILRTWYSTGHRLAIFVKSLPLLWHQPDIFHIQWAKSIKDWFWIQSFGIKIVVSLRGYQVNCSPIVEAGVAELYSRTFPKVDGFHAVSRAISIRAQQYGAPAERIQVIYSGLPLEKFSFIPQKPSAQILHIISVGRPHWNKGYNYALDACRLLQGQLDFQYTIVGGSCAEMTYHIHQSHLENHVKLTERFPFEEVQNHIQNADVLLLPSVEEGVPNVVLEAMALGTPVITTRCGGMAEVIQNGVNGFIVDVRSPRQIADALLDFMKMSVDERKKMAIHARRTIEEKFRMETMIAQMTELYQRVLRSDSSSSPNI